MNHVNPDFSSAVKFKCKGGNVVTRTLWVTSRVKVHQEALTSGKAGFEDSNA